MSTSRGQSERGEHALLEVQSCQVAKGRDSAPKVVLRSRLRVQDAVPRLSLLKNSAALAAPLGVPAGTASSKKSDQTQNSPDRRAHPRKSRRRAQDRHGAVRRHQGLDGLAGGSGEDTRAIIDPALKILMDASGATTATSQPLVTHVRSVRSPSRMKTTPRS